MTMPPCDFAVIVPAHQAQDTLPACLSALMAAGFPAEAILVVDDGSRDATGAVATRAGVRVIRNDSPERPARARNRGVAACTSEIVLFVDADVVVHADIRSRIARHFADPALTAVIGSYDSAPPAPAAVSRYRNLLHHHVHQRAAGEIGTFWTGLGAVRRAAFLEAGGLDPAWEDIEDVEFGLRLVARGGRIVLDPQMQGAHLKAWTYRSMWRTDVQGRAVPWTRLLALGRLDPAAMNAGPAHRASAAMVALAAVALLALAVTSLAGWVLVGALGAFLVLNRRFFALLWRVGGARLLAAGIPAHAVHYAAALVGYAKVRLLERPRLS
ncbi:glycosyltransferase [Citreimonas sp.]|uniref:glycosyltransferase n=1 Tax=Citreimonas sp. TaxID=3036715 RepID=UPI0035C82630